MPPKGYKIRSDGSLVFPKKRSTSAPLESGHSSNNIDSNTSQTQTGRYGSVTTPQQHMTPHQAIVSPGPVVIPQYHQQQLQSILNSTAPSRKSVGGSQTPALLPPLHGTISTATPHRSGSPTKVARFQKNTGKNEDALVRPNSVLTAFAKGDVSSIPHEATPFTRTLQQQEQQKREEAASIMMDNSFGGQSIPPPVVKLNPQNMLQGRESVLALEADLLRRLSDLEKDSDLSKHEYVSKAQRVFDDVAVEVIRQVTVHCADRGRLLAKLWVRYSDIINTISSMFVTERTRHKEEEEKSAKELRQARLDYVRVVEHSEKALKMQFDHQEKILQEQEAREGRLCEELNALKEELYRCQVKLRGVANGTVNLGPGIGAAGRSQSLSLDQRMRRQSMMSMSGGGSGVGAAANPNSVMGVLGNSLPTSDNLLEEELLQQQQQQQMQNQSHLQTQVLQVDPNSSATSVPGGNQSSSSQGGSGTFGQHLPPPSPGGSLEGGATPLPSLPASPTAGQVGTTASSSGATPAPKPLSSIIAAGVGSSSPSPHRGGSTVGSPAGLTTTTTEREMQLQKQVRELRMTLIDASNELMSYRNQHDLAYSRAVQTEPPEVEERAVSPIRELDASFLSAADESTEILQVLGPGGGRKNMRSRQGSTSVSRTLSIASNIVGGGGSSGAAEKGRGSVTRTSGGSISPPPPLGTLQTRVNSTASSNETLSVGGGGAVRQTNLSRSSSRSPTL